jgi:hypothetical protein
MHDSRNSFSSAPPAKAARELLPLLRRPDESVSTLRSLIAVTPRDVDCLRARGVAEEAIAATQRYRQSVLQEFDELVRRREA